MFKTLLIGAILAAGSSAALAADPVIGTWQLNLAKSTYSPGPAPKSMTRTYAESAQGITLTIKMTTANGMDSNTTFVFKEDGKPYPVSGTSDTDAASVTRVDPLKVNFKQMRAGVVTATGARTVSKDGKTLTVSQKGTHADGAKYNDVMVYDRQ